MSDVYEVITDDADNPVAWVKADSVRQIRDAYDGYGTAVISIDKLPEGTRWEDDVTVGGGPQEGRTFGHFFSLFRHFLAAH